MVVYDTKVVVFLKDFVCMITRGVSSELIDLALVIFCTEAIIALHSPVFALR